MRTSAVALLLLSGCFEYDLSQVPDPVPTPFEPTESHPGADGLEAGFDTPMDPNWEDPVDEGPEDPSDWWNEPWSEPPGTGEAPEGGDGGDGPQAGLARMTGGGGVDDLGDLASHAFTVHCEGTHHANQMSVDLPEGSFTLEELDWLTCLDDPALDAQQPALGFDTVVGVARGDLDGTPVDVWFQFTDDGEPGLDDHAWWIFDTPDGELEVAGYLVEGNHQVHDPVGSL